VVIAGLIVFSLLFGFFFVEIGVQRRGARRFQIQQSTIGIPSISVTILELANIFLRFKEFYFLRE